LTVLATTLGGRHGTIVDITTSVDGFVAGPNPTLEHPLGEGGERLHEWAVALEAFRERHGMEGGDANADSERLRESVDATGAVVMGRRMFSGGQGPWEGDPNADGWWGDDPPFRAPVFIVTSHARGTVAKEGGTSYTFVTDGVESAVRQAREAARAKMSASPAVRTSFSRHSGPGSWTSSGCTWRRFLLGSGTRLFEGLGGVELARTAVIDSPGVTHLTFRVVE
jgi:dihydrofolate reductase